MITASVVIPSWNRAPVVARVLEALARQTFPAEELEVVLVDDGSTDDTPTLAAATRAPFHFVYHRLERADATYWRARPVNQGIAAARGRVVILLDADMLPAPELVAEHVRVHAVGGPPRAGLGYVFGHSGESERGATEPAIPALGEIVPALSAWMASAPRACQDPREVHYRRWPRFDDCPIRWVAFWSGNLSLPRDLLQAVGGFDERIRGWGGEDTDLGYRLAQRGVEYVVCRGARGLHYPHATAASNSAEATLNCRRLLRLHPAFDMELSLWLCRFALDQRDFEPRAHESSEAFFERRLEVLEEIGEAAADLPARRGVVRADLGGWLATLPGPQAWFGPGAPAGEADPPRLVSDAAAPPGPGLRLLGLATGLAPGELGAAIAAEHWTGFPPLVARAMARELTRIAGRAFFLSSAPPPWPLPAALGPDFDCYELRLAGVHVSEVVRVDRG